MNEEEVVRVKATPEALDLIKSLAEKNGEVLFHQSGGCCDGSAPMCYPVDDYMVGDGDVHLGTIGGAQVYISASQFEYWQHTQLVIDVVPGRGGMFLAGERQRQALPHPRPCLHGRRGRRARTRRLRPVPKGCRRSLGPVPAPGWDMFAAWLSIPPG